MQEPVSSLNSDQRRAVECHHGPLLIVAGPGSGKTRVMTHRIAHMVRCGVPAESILAITFTNKAADEMLGRTLALLDDDGVGFETPPQISTFHSFCARLLRREIYHLEPYRTDFSIYDAEDQKGVVEEAASRLNLDKNAFPSTQVRSMISRWKNDMRSPEEILDLAVSHHSTAHARLYGLYQQLLVERNALDFDDLLLLALRVVREVDFVRERRQAQHEYIMIDEFQDTNRPQYLLARLLAERHKNLCITGDPDQSIYSWRGASPENFARFAEDFPGHQTVLLNRNYRSTPEILGAASRLTATAGTRALYTENPPGDPVRVQQVSSEREEAQQIVRLIEAWTLAGTRHRDIAVLYRVNSLSRSIEEEFVRSGVPYTIVGGVAFYQRKEVKDVLAYLRAAALPRDEVALRRVINTPPRGLGPSTVDRLVDLAAEAGVSLGAIVRDAERCESLPTRARTCLDPFRAMLTELETLIQRERPLSELVRAAVEFSDYAEYLKKSEPDSWDDRQRNLDELANAAQETEDLLRTRAPEPDMPSPLMFFLERIALVADIDQWEDRDDRVAAMTLHAAKGLEFDRVALAGLEQGLLPLIRLDRDSEADIDEERRLLYVGVTRARQSLTILHAATRRRFKEREQRIPSVFLAQLQGEGVISENLVPTYDWQPWRSNPANRRAPLDFDEVERDPFPADGEIDLDEDSGVRKGTRVEHDHYGRGMVTKVSGFGDMKKVTVRFEEYGEKALVLRYAPIRVLSGPDDFDPI